MNHDDLVLEIIKRVNDKMNKAEQCAQDACCSCRKPQLLIAAKEDCDMCRELRAAPALTEKYQITEAISQAPAGDLERFDAVVLFSMGISDLAKIAGGGYDGAYTETAVRSILLGKKIFLVKEAVELFGMQATAPKDYYAMLLHKAALLQRAGVIVLPYAEMLPALLGEPAQPEAPACAPCQAAAADAPAPKAEKEIKIEKRVITEKDITQAKYDGATSLRIQARAILTDLAKDYAHTQGLTITRG